MKLTHGFTAADRIWRGGSRELKDGFEPSRHQSQQSTPLLSNEHESWSISQPKSKQTVMETQQRMGDSGI